MKAKDADMKEIFSKLSEKNKDILILVARSIKVTQEEVRQTCQSAK